MLLNQKQPSFMKRSKVFLSLTTCVLAVAALAAAKRSVEHSVCYTTGGAAHTQLIQAGRACTVTHLAGRTQCTVNFNGSHRLAYTTVFWHKPMYSGS